MYVAYLLSFSRFLEDLATEAAADDDDDDDEEEDEDLVPFIVAGVADVGRSRCRSSLDDDDDDSDFII